MGDPIVRIVRKSKFFEVTVDGPEVVLHWGHLYEGTGRERMRLREAIEEKDLYLLWWAFTTAAPYTQHNGLFRMYLTNGMLNVGLGKETDIENAQDYTYHGGRVMTYHLYDDTQNRVSLWISPAESIYAGKMCETLGRVIMERRVAQAESVARLCLVKEGGK